MYHKNKKYTGKLLVRLLVALVGYAACMPLAVLAADLDADTLRFPITHYRVEGNSLLKPTVIARLLRRYIGEQRTFADIEAARATLQQAYRESGYSTVNVTLPEQELQDGLVIFKVIAARLVAVNIEGSHFYDQTNIRNSLPALVPGEVPNMRDVDTQLALANDNPGKLTTVKLRSGEQPDTIDASVQVNSSNPWRSFLTLDNSGNTQTGKYRLGLGMQYANVANRDQVLTLQYLTSPDHLNSVSAYGAGYHIPLYRLGDSIDLFAGYANINAGTVAQLFSVSGKGSIVGLRYNQHISDAASYKQKLIYGLDYRAYHNDIRFVGTPIGTDVTVHPLSLFYHGRYRNAQSECSFNLGGIQNIVGGAHGNNSDFALARAGARANYRALRADADCRHALAVQWQIRFRLSAQTTTQPLVPGEQFGIGGQHSVRGFDERLFAGDKGAQGSLELYSPDVGASLPIANAALRGLVFYDAGMVRLNDAQAGDIARTDISSAGFGLRLSVAKRMSLELDFAHILRGGSSGLTDHNRVQGSLTLVY
ncbi:ShlB/FhaC/HecB family hemolysin secretion/activation protein [Sulfuriferula sp.]|uniref:ShlB/FhaC/HecB family hemolysin secretion/activation protein n=1 Tax=Sulfuriferula sp. TaxID=2025307 RepID=UPI0027312A7D|nr:ShlB/FhaC/HecB family hemolysin secretion/activation protein [Sulfuriferula sp.]MDP2025474.1 ShlB/FhaC/HecB family hemolysin secretion/activation protein [Sulfuriferula sp.]